MDEDILKLHGDHKITTKEFYRRTWKYIKPEIFHFILAFIFIILSATADAFMPLLMQLLIDAFNSNDPTKITLLLIFGITGGALALSLITQAFIYVQSMILQKSGQRIIYRLRNEVFTHIENMSINQFNEMPVGSLVTRVANYTSSMSDLFTNTLTMLLRNIFTIIIVYSIMFYYSYQLSLMMLVILIIILVVSLIFRYLISQEFRKERKLVSDINSFLSENLSGMKISQIFNQEKRKSEEFAIKNKNIFKQRFKVTSLFAFYRPFISFLYYGAIALTFISGIYFNLTAGMITAFYLYLGKFFNPIQNISDQLNQIQNAKTASERIYNLLDVKPDVIDETDAIEVDKFNGEIVFKNVWFAYEKDNWILKDVSFDIKAKSTCAFVGATGAGKTTILSLLVRNYEIQKGEILIDGINIKHIKIECLRKNIGQMLQDVFLFSGTIRSNITLRDDEYKDEEIMNVCRYVNADKFIDKLDNKLDSPVIEKGENFSQGQRQLLSFARTVLHKPQILILDEATANIDTETEKLIQESLLNMRSIGTMLIVAHRLSTIQNADKIICLQNGQVVEEGNHQQLLKKKGYYYKLYLLQFKDKN